MEIATTGAGAGVSVPGSSALAAFCPACGEHGLDVQGIETADASARGFDAYCDACGWSGDIMPDALLPDFAARYDREHGEKRVRGTNNALKNVQAISTRQTSEHGGMGIARQAAGHSGDKGTEG